MLANCCMKKQLSECSLSQSHTNAWIWMLPYHSNPYHMQQHSNRELVQPFLPSLDHQQLYQPPPRQSGPNQAFTPVRAGGGAGRVELRIVATKFMLPIRDDPGVAKTRNFRKLRGGHFTVCKQLENEAWQLVTSVLPSSHRDLLSPTNGRAYRSIVTVTKTLRPQLPSYPSFW